MSNSYNSTLLQVDLYIHPLINFLIAHAVTVWGVIFWTHEKNIQVFVSVNKNETSLLTSGLTFFMKNFLRF